MGCHTWFYKKVNRTYEEAKAKWIRAKKKDIAMWLKLCSKLDESFRRTYDWPQDYYGSSLQLSKRQLRMVEKGLCRYAVMNQQPEDEDGRYYWVNNALYCTNNDMPHDLFRIGGYPEDKLFSLVQTLQFLEDHDKTIHYRTSIFDNTPRHELKAQAIDKLKLFWEQYPDGMIDFG